MEKLNTLRFWCQTVLPQIYDDSLSYYELLNKVVSYLNATITKLNSLSGNVEEFEGNISTQVSALTDGVTSLAETVSSFDDRITANTNDITINGRSIQNLDNESLKYLGMASTFPNVTRKGYYFVPALHSTGYPSNFSGSGTLLLMSDSVGEAYIAVLFTTTGVVYTRQYNGWGWSEWASEDIANENSITQAIEDIGELQEEDIKTLKYRGFTIRQDDLGELDATYPPQYYRSGYYTPRIEQGDMPTGETITAQNQYRYLITVINNFTNDPADIVDRSERTWILYGPNAKMWWAHGSKPTANTWFVFDPSAIDVSNLEQMVQNLSDQYDAVDDRVDTIDGEAAKWGEHITNGAISSLGPKMLQNAIYYVTKDSNFPGYEWTNGLLVCRKGSSSSPTMATLMTDTGGIYTNKYVNGSWGGWKLTTPIRYFSNYNGIIVFPAVKYSPSDFQFFVYLPFSVENYPASTSAISVTKLLGTIYDDAGVALFASDTDFHDETNYHTSVAIVAQNVVRVTVHEIDSSGPIHSSWQVRTGANLYINTNNLEIHF